MSTRSTISVVLNDGTVRSIYCHFDGYLEGVGAQLLKHYNSQDLADALIKLGDLSVLGDRIDPINQHSFNYPEDGTCIYYARDRGDDPKKCEPRTFMSFLEYRMCNEFQHMNYIFFDGKWRVYYPETKEMELLEDLIK